MEPIESSETSAYINTLTPGTYPKEKKLQYKEHETLHITAQDTLTLKSSSVRLYLEPATSLVLVHILVYFNVLCPTFYNIE